MIPFISYTQDSLQWCKNVYSSWNILPLTLTFLFLTYVISSKVLMWGGRKPIDNATVKHITTNITTNTKLTKQKISKTFTTTLHTKKFTSQLNHTAQKLKHSRTRGITWHCTESALEMSMQCLCTTITTPSFSHIWSLTQPSRSLSSTFTWPQPCC